MIDFDMTKEDASKIVGWFSTDVGQSFLEYLATMGQGNTADLMVATDIHDVYRAQGRAHQLRRVLDFLTHAERVINGDIPASPSPEGSGDQVSDPADLGGASLDDWPGVGPTEGS